MNVYLKSKAVDHSSLRHFLPAVIEHHEESKIPDVAESAFFELLIPLSK